jgi:hypothetical protein
MTKDELEAIKALEYQSGAGIANGIAENIKMIEEKVKNGELPPPPVYDQETIDRVIREISDPNNGAYGRRKKAPDPESTVAYNYDELTEEQKQQQAGNIAGDDVAEEEAIRQWEAENPIEGQLGEE